MAQKGTEILSYRGDPNLGLGSNANIPAISKDANLDLINQTARDIAMMNHSNNIKLFDQKIKDRDNTLELLAAGQISAGKIDPNDRKVYDESKKKVSDNFYEMIKNGGLNNPEAVRKYYDSVSELKNVATWAQSRQLEFDKLNAEKSTQTLNEDIELFDGHIKKMKEQPFWDPIVPMQKAFNYDINEATSSYLGNPITGSSIGKGEKGTETTQWNTVTDKNGVVTNKTTTKKAPIRSAQLTRQVPKTGTGVTVKPDGSLSEISYTAEKYWDYPTIETNVQEAYISSAKDRQTQIEWFNDVNAYPDAEKIKLLQAYNNRIAQYNQERGIETVGTNPDGTPRYDNQVKFSADPTGKILIQETPSSFMAKHTLASIDGNYVEKPKAEVDYKILDNNTRVRLEAMGNANSLRISRENNSSQERISKANRDARGQGGGEVTYDGTQGNSFDGMTDAERQNFNVKDGTFYNKDGTIKNGNVFIYFADLPATVKSALKAGGIEIKEGIQNKGVNAVVTNGKIQSISNKDFGTVTREDMEGVYQPKMDTEPLKGKKLKFSTPSGSDKKMSDAEYDEFLRKNGLK